MAEAKLHKRLAGHLSDQHAKEGYLIIGFAVLTVSLHFYLQVAEVKRTAGFNIVNSQTIPYIYMVITLGLLINVIGLSLRNAAGLWLSLMALTGVGVAYVVWYIYSRQILELLLAQPFYHSYPEAIPSHNFGLISATWLNLAVLVMSGILLICEIKTLRSMAAAQQ
jgi:hypothetical protein